MLRDEGCREVQAVVGGELYLCHREVVPGTEYYHWHQPKPETTLGPEETYGQDIHPR